VGSSLRWKPNAKRDIRTEKPDKEATYHAETVIGSSRPRVIDRSKQSTETRDTGRSAAKIQAVTTTLLRSGDFPQATRRSAALISSDSLSFALFLLEKFSQFVPMVTRKLLQSLPLIRRHSPYTSLLATDGDVAPRFAQSDPTRLP